MGTAVADRETHTAVLDRSAALQQRSKQFSAVYERNAYLVFNLALRICCDEAQAIECAQQAFLSRVASDDLEEGLATAVVASALAVAVENPTPSGAGDAEAQQMLTATARLTPPQRAALAVLGLTETSVEGLAAMLSLSPDAAARLHERALSELGAGLGRGVDVATTYRAWLWAAPPDQLWESVFALFYVAADGLIRDAEPPREADAPTQAVSAVKQTRKQRRAAKRAAAATAASAAAAAGQVGAVAQSAAVPVRSRRRLRPSWLPVRLMLVILASLAAVAVAASQLGWLPGSSRPTFANSGAGAVAPSFGKLSPSQLDALRLKELQQSRAYANQQARQHPPLSPAQLALQQRKLELQAQQQARSQTAAKQRERAKKVALAKKQRDAQLLALQQQAQQLQAQRDAQARQQLQRPPASAPLPGSTQRPPPASRPRPQRPSQPPPSSSPGSGSGSASDANCLYNPDTKSYVCPSG